MFGWLARKQREAIRRRHFETNEVGTTIYVPHGLGALASNAAYVVPDAATAERIVAIHARSTLVTMGLILACMVGFVAAFWMLPPEHWLANWALGGVVIGVVGASVFELTWPARKASAGLARAPDRSMRDRLEGMNRQLGSKRRLWALIIFTVGLLAGTIWQARQDYLAGHVDLAMVLEIIGAVAYIPFLALGVPYFLRMRHHREENARLEGIVRERTAELEELNKTLELRVEEQVRDIERLGQLRHFFTAPVADLILSGDAQAISRVHRRELTVISIDLRGFTAFSETAEPEEVIGVLRTYHAELGILVNRYQGTLEHFAGDGAVIFLNDPVELPDHPQRAVRLATELQAAMRPHIAEWRRLGFDLGMGVGVAVGYATIGAIGYEGRWEYAAIGNVVNLANRLCSEAKDGQVVTTHRVGSRIDPATKMSPLGELTLKGFAKPVAAFNVAAS